jgi:predicted acyltransferase
MDPSHSQRLSSLDIFRGLTIAAMIVVNNPGSGLDGACFRPLVHSNWHGCNAADLIFPFFVFILGLSTAISLAKRRARGAQRLPLYLHIGRRSFILLFLGIFGQMCCGWVCQAICPPTATQESIWSIFFRSPLETEAFFYSLDNLRLPGVLQRLALVYLGVALLTLHTNRRVQALVAGGLLCCYWGLLSLPGFSLEPGADLGAWLDRNLFGPGHLYRETWDPEGLLSTMPALANGLLGALTGQWLSSGRSGRINLTGLLGCGTTALLVGWVWGFFLPLNKNLWTSSFALYSAGWALIILGALYWLFDYRQVRSGYAEPLVWLGQNALQVYCLSRLLNLTLELLYLGTPAQHRGLMSCLRTNLFGEYWEVNGLSWWTDLRWPSLYWALLCLLVWTAFTGLVTYARTYYKSRPQTLQPLALPTSNFWDADHIAGGFVGG